MLIPMVLSSGLACLAVMGAQAIGFMPMFTNVQAPWATPFLFSGFLVSGWRGMVVQLGIVVLTVLVYLPFTRALDKRFEDEELALKRAEIEATE